MKKLLALFVALAFLAGSASISLAQTGNGGSVVTNSDVSKSAPAKVHSKKKAKTTKKTGITDNMNL